MSQRTVAHMRPHSTGGICKLYTPGGLGLITIHSYSMLDHFTAFWGSFHKLKISVLRYMI
jgi:hypothetical protein